MAEVILISNVRLSFPHLIDPQRNVDAVTGKERVSYNCELIMPKEHPGFVAFMRQYSEMAAAEWKDHAAQVMQMIQNDRKSRCYGLGEEKVNKKTFTPYDGYPGMVFITAGSNTPPQIIQDDGNPIDPANTMAYQLLTRKMYGGCRVNAAVKPWIQKNKHGNGIRCDLVALQFAADDVAFGDGPKDASGLFGAVGTTAPTQQAPAGLFGAAVAPAPTGVIPGLPSFLQGM